MVALGDRQSPQHDHVASGDGHAPVAGPRVGRASQLDAGDAEAEPALRPQ